MEEIIFDRVTMDGMREIKLASDKAVPEARMLCFFHGPAMEYAKVNCYGTAALSLFYGEITFPLRVALELNCEGWVKPRRFGVWRLMKEDPFRVSEVIEWMAEWYFVQTHHRAGYAFMRSVPDGKDCTEVAGLTLIQAEWALEKCVMVGG